MFSLTGALSSLSLRRITFTLSDMSERVQRDPVLDEWQQNLAAQIRAMLAVDKQPHSQLARAMGMRETALSRRLLGQVSFSAEELLFLADWMNKNIDDIMAAAKARATNPCMSHSNNTGVADRLAWATRGYVLAGMTPRLAREAATRWYRTASLRVA